MRVCVIDLGTNSFHAVIIDAHPNGTFTVLDKIKEMVRLGEEGLSDHQLPETAMKRGLQALRRIKILARGWQVSDFMAYATSAIREAYNGGDFIERAWKEVGIHIRPIRGELEAHLIYQGVKQAVDIPNMTLLVDIGGGSTEFIVGTSQESYFETSLKLGAARMTERFVTTDPVVRKEFRAMRAYFREQLAPVYEAALRHGVTEIIGSSGTMENLAQVYANRFGQSGLNIFQQNFPAKDVRRVTKEIMTSTRAEREAMKGIDEKRVPQIVAGATLVDVLLKDLPVQRLRVSPYALREGMAVYYIETNYERLEELAPFADVRRRSVHELGFSCGWDKQHAEQVSTLALHLFDATRSVHGLGFAERELLEYAGLLHDVGYLISRSGHHKHGRYLILNADLHGFLPHEIDIMAYTVRYHRKALPKKKHKGFQKLPKKRRRTIRKLGALLRLAEGLDRSHYQNVIRLDTELTDEALHLTLHCKNDPQVDVWGARTHSGFFEREFDRVLK
ncbi:MAG: HD domain-containing protein, partial [Bacteroidetes bacterium]|nr:HD domain-containing protein [Bacteroidota bacterium]